GDLLEITVDKDFMPEPGIARKRDYNNLGAGIAIGLPEISGGSGYASTAGVGYKYNASAGKVIFYIITAGHCIITKDPLGYQYKAVVGRDHHDARVSGYDMGLIRITDDNTLKYGRYATNGLYEYAERSDYYDQKIKDWNYMYRNQPVRKSGVKTGVTVGWVDSVDWKWDYTNDGYGWLYGALVRSKDAKSPFSGAGDSGAVVYEYNSSNNDYYAVGLISGATGGEPHCSYVTRMYDVVRYYSDSNYSFNLYTYDTRTKAAN
ncbi:MAG: hypothetical protein IBX64_13950, partial [Actinobacteria bacterium]|nr:hypothetical protein [Actinomycetota bacterium]